jgi:large subunit ribosomal protein L6
MSHIGRKAIVLPQDVKVDVSGNVVSIRGPKGTLSLTLLPEVSVSVRDEGGSRAISVQRGSDDRHARARHGLTRALLANMVEGVTKGYEKTLQVMGVGYRAQIKGNVLELHVGYSHPVTYEMPAGVCIRQDQKDKSLLTVSGIDKEKVGQAAADIRSFRKPEPYKGKGIRYAEEVVRKKAGKAVVKGGAPGASAAA